MPGIPDMPDMPGTPDMPELARHQLFWPSRAGWQAIFAHSLDNSAPGGLAETVLAQVRAWPLHDWPLVVARQALEMAQGGQLALGLPLPPDARGEKVRLALALPRALLPGAMQALRAPLGLQDALLRLEQLRWQPAAAGAVSAPLPATLAAMQRFAQQAQPFSLAVYGSWSWQALTGLPYLHAASDLDLLFTPRDAGQLAAGLRLLQAAGASLPLDGEIIFPDGAAVAWREWLKATQIAGGRVLCKGPQTVSLQTVRQMLDRLDAAAPDRTGRAAQLPELTPVPVTGPEPVLSATVFASTSAPEAACR